MLASLLAIENKVRFYVDLDPLHIALYVGEVIGFRLFRATGLLSLSARRTVLLGKGVGAYAVHNLRERERARAYL